MSDVPRASDAVDGGNDVYRRALEDLTEHAFVTLAPDGIITSWNVGAERLFGHAPERAVGAHISTIFRSDDQGSGVTDRGPAARRSARFSLGQPMGDGCKRNPEVRAGNDRRAAPRCALRRVSRTGPGNAGPDGRG